ncbi:MAG: hypothetical protein JRI46_01405 [Deltaproteobacteria bacterium]|nr:hypothetical protein [Deltaproteobacteria bacterium]
MLNPDFRDILSLFIEEDVEFLVVGAYALAAHGYPRATGDIDLWVRCSDENAQCVWRSLAKFGAPLQDLKVEDLAKPDIVFQIGVAPRRIDIMTILDGVGFDEAWPHRKEVEVEGLKLPIISKAHLLQNKKASGRPRDLADVAWLEENDN